MPRKHARDAHQVMSTRAELEPVAARNTVASATAAPRWLPGFLQLRQYPVALRLVPSAHCEDGCAHHGWLVAQQLGQSGRTDAIEAAMLREQLHCLRGRHPREAGGVQCRSTRQHWELPQQERCSAVARALLRRNTTCLPEMRCRCQRRACLPQSRTKQVATSVHERPRVVPHPARAARNNASMLSATGARQALEIEGKRAFQQACGGRGAETAAVQGASRGSRLKTCCQGQRWPHEAAACACRRRGTHQLQAQEAADTRAVAATLRLRSGSQPSDSAFRAERSTGSIPLAVADAAQDVEVRKPAVRHAQLLARRRISACATNVKHTQTRTCIARRSQRGAAADGGELTSLPRAAQDVSNARRPLQHGA
jgi:hypothetical protein